MMELFTYKDIYDEAGKRILEVNILPEKYCTFDCVFCPIGRSPHKVDTIQDFGDVQTALSDLAYRMDGENRIWYSSTPGAKRSCITGYRTSFPLSMPRARLYAFSRMATFWDKPPIWA